MFEQHPVPQQISSYQFRLVGDMTIKQFFQVAGGAVIALVFYALPLPSFLRWPLVISSLIFGAAFAFLPIQERPMEEWIAAFFRSVYSPTVFFWNPDVTKQQYFAADSATQVPDQQTQSNQIASAVTEDKSVAVLENAEKSALSKLMGLFSHKPNTTPAPATDTQQIQATDSGILTAGVPEVVQPTPITEVVVPPQIVPEIKDAGYTVPTESTKVAVELAKEEAIPQTLSGSTTTNVQQAQFSIDAAPPMIPEYPNVIVGQVMTNDKHIVEGAILEIKDSEGRSVRALKTNKAGHFFIVTPLMDGQYQMEVEKEGLTFDPISISINGEIIPPIAITANI